MTTGKRLLITGADHANPNRGVQALMYSTVSCLLETDPEVEVVCQAFGARSVVQSGRTLAAWNAPPRPGTKVSLKRRLRDAVDRFGEHPSRRFANASAVLDISGGDAFATIYGPTSYERQCVRKEGALRRGVPLVLLPQTFGPFDDEGSRRRAGEIVRGAAAVATREAHGASELSELLAVERSDIEVVPDVAFTLLPADPGDAEWDRIRRWRDSEETMLLGCNVSGLLWSGKKGFDASAFEHYRQTTISMIRHYLGMGGRVMLIPHVSSAAPGATREGSDEDACRSCWEMLSDDERPRVLVPAINSYDCAHMKSVIGLCDHFCGSRMHSWIGAASQAIPALSLAYSKKAQGVLAAFADVPLVVDLAGSEPGSINARLEWLVEDSQPIRSTLETAVTDAKARIERYFRGLLADIFDESPSSSVAASPV